MSTSFRTERDSMGEMVVPADAYYGAQTARAVENFPISGLRFSRSFIAALGTIKAACARVNADLGLLDRRLADAIERAASEVRVHPRARGLDRAERRDKAPREA